VNPKVEWYLCHSCALELWVENVYYGMIFIDSKEAHACKLGYGLRFSCVKVAQKALLEAALTYRQQQGL